MEIINNSTRKFGENASYIFLKDNLGDEDDKVYLFTRYELWQAEQRAKRKSGLIPESLWNRIFI